MTSRCQVLFPYRPQASSLRSKRFRGAKSEEETGLSAFCPREKWGESKNKKERVGEGKEGTAPSYFCSRPIFRAGKTPKAPVLLRSLLHGNACYAGYQAREKTLGTRLIFSLKKNLSLYNTECGITNMRQ